VRTLNFGPKNRILKSWIHHETFIAARDQYFIALWIYYSWRDLLSTGIFRTSMNHAQ